jgi:hypothetical protein
MVELTMVPLNVVDVVIVLYVLTPRHRGRNSFVFDYICISNYVLESVATHRHGSVATWGR